MSTVTKSIDVDVPVTMAYNQWTQFEEFPHFMEGVKEVRQIDDQHLHWHAEIGGKEQTWQAQITAQIPDQRIAWRSMAGEENAGVVTFHRIDDNTTRVTLQIDYNPKGFAESIGDALGFMDRRVEGDLKRFKDFIEQRGGPTGGWRGTIEEHPEPDIP